MAAAAAYRFRRLLDISGVVESSMSLEATAAALVGVAEEPGATGTEVRVRCTLPPASTLLVSPPRASCVPSFVIPPDGTSEVSFAASNRFSSDR